MAAALPSEEKQVEEILEKKPDHKPAMNAKTFAEEELFNVLKSGSELTKVRSAKKKYTRTYNVSDDLKFLQYSGSAKFFSDVDSGIPIENIQEIRSGIQTDTFNKANKKNIYAEEQCFSILHGNNEKSLDLCAESADLRNKWIKGLQFLTRKAKADAQKKQEQRWIRSFYELADKNNDGWISFKEVMRLLDKMNVQMPKQDVLTMYKQASGDKDERYDFGLSYQEFVSFYYLLTKRPEILDIFNKYTDGEAVMTAQQLLKFYTVAQKQTNLDEEACEGVIAAHEPEQELKDRNVLSLKGFRHLLMCDTEMLSNPKHKTIYQDMNQPLNQYWIASSHNTYLSRDQLKGPSKVECYINALKKGCRCVELDCWDGDKFEPVIYHGYTLTSKILFRDAISAISDYAFEATPYPLILSLENHCSIDQQKVMAHHLKTLLGDQLYMEQIPGEAETFPSPEDLKNKILIKGKRLPAEVENMDDGEISEDDEAAECENDEVKEEVKKNKSGKKIKVAKELSDMVNYCKAVHFHDFEHSRNSYKFYEMSSFGESKADKLVEEQTTEFNNHNRIFLSRIYPGGLRTDSSNYNPVPMWNAGCQIVALNYQTGDEEMNINLGRFSDNGGSGFVLKPEYMRSSAKFHPDGPFQDDMTRKLKIKIISGAMLPKANKDKEIIDPYVKIKVNGASADTREFKTNFVEDNGLNPMWNEEFTFSVGMPDLAIVRFCVYDHDQMSGDEFIGQYTLPFNSMQQGYRHVALYSKDNDSLFPSVLLVHVELI